MNPWFAPWWNMFKAPFSGNVTQEIAPVTSWLSPQLEVNFAGNPKLEAKVISDVASYGKQLGILTEAVLEIAEGKKKGDALTKLKALTDQVEALKQAHEKQLEQELKNGLDRLKQEDPKTLKDIIKAYT